MISSPLFGSDRRIRLHNSRLTPAQRAKIRSPIQIISSVAATASSRPPLHRDSNGLQCTKVIELIRSPRGLGNLDYTLFQSLL